jgi:hypothetical protein
MRISLLLAMAIGASFIGSNCGGSGVGDPCVPEDEYLTSFNGFSQNEVNIESRSFQCLTRVCLVNHFQGRVSCPYGQVEDPMAEGSGLATCMGTSEHRSSVECLPGGALHSASCQVPDRDGARWEDRIAVPVSPQFQERTADVTVYCSCRCAGDGDEKTFCECPSNYDCSPLVEDLGLGKGQLAGSYCIKKGTLWDPGDPAVADCDPNSTSALCNDDFTYVKDGLTLGRNQDKTACLPSGSTCSKKDGDTCCKAPTVVTCTDTEVNGEERTCNGTCVDGKCEHVPGDATTRETIYAVEIEDCPGTKCN